MAAYFYDSYAVIEFIQGNPKYAKYFEVSDGVLTFMNLMEIHHALIQKFSEQESDRFTRDMENMVVTPTLEQIIIASKFRKNNSRKNLSYADCLGYVIAGDMKIKFLTGDKAFAGMPNVEFVK